MAMVIYEYKCTDCFTSSDSTMQFYLQLERIACEFCLSSGHPQPFSQIDTPNRSYKNHKVTSSNVSQEHLEFLGELKKNENVVIKQSDKCKGLVLMDKCDYLNKSHAILSD